MKMSLISKKEELGGVISFLFQPEENFSYLPGQYLRYVIPDPQPDERGVNRFFSIASAPSEGIIMLSTKFALERGSSFKDHLKNINVGDQIEAIGPYGDFVLPEDLVDKKFCLIAGGIGITPFRSMLIDLKDKNLTPDIDLLYANRNLEIPFKEELEKLKAGNPNLKINYIVDPQRVDEETIKRLVTDYQERLFYVSGPEPMVQGILKILEEMGLDKDQIKRDFFPGYTII
jgi:glycine betaine catabolism B